jgi:hypothetical protein
MEVLTVADTSVCTEAVDVDGSVDPIAESSAASPVSTPPLESLNRQLGELSLSPCFIRGRISADVADLDALKAAHGTSLSWIPDSSTCRPPPEKLLEKAKLRESIMIEWRTVIDYIAHTVFDCDVMIDSLTRKKYTSCAIEGKKRFVQCIFPYQIATGHHCVLWYGSQTEIPDDIINQDCVRFIQSIVGTEAKFQFGWYLNPKKTIKEIFHVQVFWISE